ncbi:uncharacterized protein LOC144602708 isoform X2 [Rhinoraja longicauda]
MEETQLLWDPDQRDPRGRLRILTGSLKAESALVEFMVFEGLNVIGRDENCHIQIPVQSVSRRHAVIEVEGESHVIRDCDSLNSTWRKKVFLKPHVRYDISDGDLFLFGDVACQYHVLPPAAQDSDSGSETGSESVLTQARVRAGAERPEEGAESGPIAEEGNSDAELTGDSMVVSPTPSHQRRLPARVTQPDAYVKESEDDDTPWKGSRSLFVRSCQGPSTSVYQTPSGNIVPESDDEAENVTRSTAEPTQLHYDSDTDLEADQHPGEASAGQSTEQTANGLDPRPEPAAAVTGAAALGDLSAGGETAASEAGDGVGQENGHLSSQPPVATPTADTSDLYALEPTQCFTLTVSSSQDETLLEENCTTPGDPCTTRSPEEDAARTFNPQSPVFTKEPSQSDPVNTDSLEEDATQAFELQPPTFTKEPSQSDRLARSSGAEPPVSKAAGTASPPHRDGSEHREEGGLGPEDPERWASDDTQLFCAEQRPNGEEEEEEEGNADRPSTPPSPRSEGGSVAEPAASPGPSEAADGGERGQERGTVSRGDGANPGAAPTAEASPPRLAAEVDARDPGTETPAAGRAAGRRGRGRRLQRREAGQPADSPPGSPQTPARSRGGPPQLTAGDPPEEGPRSAAKAQAKRRPAASPRGGAEVAPATQGPAQQRTRGRSNRRKQECTTPCSPETETPSGRLRSSRAASQPDGDRDASVQPQVIPPSPGSEGGSVAEPAASPGPSEAADGGERGQERGTISRGDGANPGAAPTAEASPPGLAAEVDARDPGPETPSTGRAAERRGRGRKSQRREAGQPAESPPGSPQTPTRPGGGPPQPTAGDPLEEGPRPAAKAQAKRRPAASPRGGAEVAPATQGPAQQRTRGRSSRMKQECTTPCSPETEKLSGRLRSSRSASQPDGDGDASVQPQVKTRRQTCQPSPSSSLASLSESPVAPKVMFTGLVDEEGEKVIEQLGGEVVESVYDSTHLVANRVRRTVKFMCAIARGIPVVTSEWLKQSGRNRYYLSPRSFLLGDREQERNFNFSIRDSIQKAKEQRLLQDYRIHVTPGVQPDPGQMATILRCSGAMVLPNMPRANKEKTLVISCAGDLPKCKAALNANIPVVDVEFALTGILQQAVDLGKYRLGSDEAVSHSKPQGKGRSLRSLATGSSPVPGGKRKKR